MSEHEPQCFTFGQKYRREPHPILKQVDVDGWVEVRGGGLMAARKAMFAVAQEFWGFQYDLRDINPEHFPNGAFLVIEIDEDGNVLNQYYTKEIE